MGWFAVECHYTPDQVFDMPWVPLIRLTLLADDMAEARAKANGQTAPAQERPMRKMA